MDFDSSVPPTGTQIGQGPVAAPTPNGENNASSNPLEQLDPNTLLSGDTTPRTAQSGSTPRGYRHRALHRPADATPVFRQPVPLNQNEVAPRGSSPVAGHAAAASTTRRQSRFGSATHCNTGHGTSPTVSTPSPMFVAHAQPLRYVTPPTPIPIAILLLLLPSCLVVGDL